jgi:N-methylhydantoinase B/oxoprolinase/acetone carboxylase alpha subunit
MCRVSIADDGIEVDFDGTSAICTHGINVPLTYTQAYASFGVRCVIGNDVPNNAGSLGVVRVAAPAARSAGRRAGRAGTGLHQRRCHTARHGPRAHPGR